MLGESAQAAGRIGEAPRLSSEVSERLHTHAWPGNLRELRNVSEFACAMGAEGAIGVGDLPDGWAGAEPAAQRAAVGPSDLPPTDERARLLNAMQRANGNVSEAARLLGVSRMTMYRHMAKAGVAVRRTGH